MEYHQFYGISIAEKGWVPTASYSLRRNRILKIIDPLPMGHLLEIGCGSGALLYDLINLGFSAEAMEISDSAFEMATYVHQSLYRSRRKVHIYQKEQSHWKENFDYLMAFEVLEHIENDLGALTKWRNWLKNRGYLLISVPAHSRWWNATDIWAGHYRRYERKSIISLLQKAGFDIIHIENYAFPLGNIISPIRGIYHARLLKKNVDMEEKNNKQAYSKRSGTERKLECHLFPLQASWLGKGIMKFFFLVQGIFASTELGPGLLVLCRKRG